MLNLTFGEQVKIILSRKGMTIKELAETIEQTTGKKMSRQNLTQRLGRDNFQEQDMRMIAEILGCPFRLSILADNESVERAAAIQEIEPTSKELSKIRKKKEEKASSTERDVTIGELVDIHKELDELAESVIKETKESKAEKTDTVEPIDTSDIQDVLKEVEQMEKEAEAAEKGRETKKPRGWRAVFQRKTRKEDPVTSALENLAPKDVKPVRTEPAMEEQVTEEPTIEESVVEVTEPEAESVTDYIEYEETNTEPAEEIVEGDVTEEIEETAEIEEDTQVGDINPITGREFETNSVRSHPKRIGYVQVYDREDHAWTDMTEWAFLGYQERKKALLGKDYEPPVYLE